MKIRKDRFLGGCDIHTEEDRMDGGGRADG